MNQPKDFHITAVKDTNFEPDQYGNHTFSIDVAEHQGSLLWRTKNRPEVGSVVYGHTEMSKSGKAMLFKKDQREEGQHPAQSHTPGQGEVSIDRQDSIRWQVCIKEANAYVIAYRPDLDAVDWAKDVTEYANALYSVTTEPQKTQEDKVKELLGGEDVKPDDDDINGSPSDEDYANIPF